MTRNHTTDAGAEGAPIFTVVAGNPTPTELAAVTAVLTALTEEASATAVPTEPVSDEWARSQRVGRKPMVPGAGAWNRVIR